MRFFLISYDIVESNLDKDAGKLSPSEREERLIQKLKELGPTTQLLNNQWALRCSKEPVEIRDYLKEHFGLSDRMVVAQSFEGDISHWWTIESLNGF
jgi:hypothetical protein